MKNFDLDLEQLYFKHYESDSPLVYIRILYFNYYKTFGYQDMVIRIGALEKMVESYNRNCKRTRYYKKKFYSELTNLKLRPDTDLHDYCIGLLKYICSYIDIDVVKNETSKGNCFLLVKIDLDDETLSCVNSSQYDKNLMGDNGKDPYRLIGMLTFCGALTIPSRLRFLTTDEQKCFFKLLDLIRLNGINSISLTENQLENLWVDELEDIRIYQQPYGDNILNRLIDFDLIDFDDVLIQINGKTVKIEREYSICDIELYEELFHDNS